MLATPERVRGYSAGPDRIVWHKPAGRGDGDWQGIACSPGEGIVMPWPSKDVPLRLDVSGEEWCPECLAILRAK